MLLRPSIRHFRSNNVSPHYSLGHETVSEAASDKRYFRTNQIDSPYSGTSREGLNCIRLSEIDHIVDMDTGFEPEHSVGFEIDVFARAV